MRVFFGNRAKRAAPLAALMLLAACTTPTPTGINVTRFHLGGPVARGSIAVVPGNPAQGGTLEFQTYAQIAADELKAHGFAPVGSLLPAEYVATLGYSQTAQTVSKGAPATIGFGVGGASFGGGGGVSMGTGVDVPVGGGVGTVVVNQVALQIKRRSDMTLIWEGSATAMADGGTPNAALGNAMPGLVRALLTDFPGVAGKTITYKQ